MYLVLSFKTKAAAEASLAASIANAANTIGGVQEFQVAKNVAEEEAVAILDQFKRILGDDIVDSFKPRMCILPKVQTDYTVDYTPDPLRMTVLSDEGQGCSYNYENLEQGFLYD